MLAQVIVHCAFDVHTNMPKHVVLGIAIHNMTRSKQLFTMLSRMGHCDSYVDINAMHTSLAEEIMAKSNLLGVVVPPNISPGVFAKLQQIIMT